MNTRISELVMHGWDIRSLLDPSTRLSPAAIPMIMELLPSFFHWQFWQGERLNKSVRYRFELTGPANRNINILVEGDKAYYDIVDDRLADVTFHCTTEIFVLMMYGRLKTEELMVRGDLTVEGKHNLAIHFGQWFSGT